MLSQIQKIIVVAVGIALLLGAAFASACTTVNSTQLANATTFLNSSDCYYLQDLNTTLQGKITPLNLSWNLSYASANFSYNNTNYGIYLNYSAFPYFNANRTLSYGNCWNITDNVTRAYCEQAPVNQPVSNYSISELNFSIWLPSMPIGLLNQTSNCTQNATIIYVNNTVYVNSTNCSARPFRNYTINASETLNLTVSDNLTVACRNATTPTCPICQNTTITNNVCLAFNEKFTLDAGTDKQDNQSQNTYLCALPKHDSTIELTANASSFEISNETLFIYANFTGLERIPEGAWFYNVSVNAQCKNLINITDTLGTDRVICIDDMDYYCAWQEIKAGQIGACLQRLTLSDKQAMNSTAALLNNCSVVLQQTTNGQLYFDRMRADQSTMIFIASIVILLLVAGFILIKSVAKSQKTPTQVVRNTASLKEQFDQWAMEKFTPKHESETQ